MERHLDPDAMPTWLASVLATRLNTPNLLAGVNDDDCAVVAIGDTLIAITVDYVNARPIAIELKIGDMHTIGRLAVASSISDLCGTGAEPIAFLAAITMPRDSSEKQFKELTEGIRSEAAKYRVSVIGGDTKLGQSLAVAGVGMGIAPSSARLFLKYKARAGDLIWVSGHLGSVSAAVLGFDMANTEDWKRWAIATLTEPQVPVDKSRELSRAKVATAGTDISDGLGMDLSQLCASSGVGAIVFAESIRIAPQAESVARKLNVAPWSLAFGTGGDFQFIVTAPPEAENVLADIGFHHIGQITEDRSLVLKINQDRTAPLPTGGHSDARNLSFSQEIRSLVHDAAMAGQ